MEGVNENNKVDVIKDSLNDNESSIDKKGKIKKKSNLFLEWIVPIVIAIVIALLVKKFIVFKAYIPSPSMVPTLNVEDQLFATRVYNLGNLKRGNIVVFHSEELNDTLIKRLIGLPGDDVSIVNGKVSVNGEELDESYVKNHDEFYGEYHVPEGKYFFLGDNRPVSYDSRKWVNSFVDGKDIIAKAQIKVYPFKDFGIINK